jgi:hypothetical protein
MNFSELLKQASSILGNTQGGNITSILQLTSLLSGVLLEQKQDKFYLIGFKQNEDGSDYTKEVKLSKDEYKLLRAMVLIMKPAFIQLSVNNPNIKITPYTGGYSTNEIKDFVFNNANQPDKLFGLVINLLDYIDDEIYKKQDETYVLKMNPVIYYLFVIMVIFVSFISTINPNMTQGYLTFDSLLADIEKVKKGEPINNLGNAGFITIWVVANRFIEQAEKDNMTTLVDVSELENLMQLTGINPTELLKNIK